MRKACFILMLAFAAVFSVSKVTANNQGASAKCFGYGINATHDQQKVSKTIKNNVLTSCFQESGDVEDDSFDKENNNNYKEKFVLLTSLAMHNSISFAAVNKLHCKRHYGNPYNDIVQLPIYILNHALIIPFS